MQNRYCEHGMISISIIIQSITVHTHRKKAWKKRRKKLTWPLGFEIILLLLCSSEFSKFSKMSMNDFSIRKHFLKDQVRGLKNTPRTDLERWIRVSMPTLAFLVQRRQGTLCRDCPERC